MYYPAEHQKNDCVRIRERVQIDNLYALIQLLNNAEYPGLPALTKPYAISRMAFRT